MKKGNPRNLWPVAILAAFALFISGTVVLIVIACSNPMDLVSADYYEQELQYQARLDQLKRTGELGAQAAVDYVPAAQRITVRLPVSHLGPDLVGNIVLYRPSAARLDRQVKLSPDPHAVQHLDASDLQPGVWKVHVLWSVGKRDYFIDQLIMVRGISKPNVGALQTATF